MSFLNTHIKRGHHCDIVPCRLVAQAREPSQLFILRLEILLDTLLIMSPFVELVDQSIQKGVFKLIVTRFKLSCERRGKDY